ncbi:MAG TPA: hypothetical protein VMS40_12345 [Vicinamibacterales bacterium]|nr:hypothetical protein [Vicinamibacterales bacterium]
MNLDETAEGTLVVTYDSRGLTKLMLVATALFVGVAGYDLFVGARGSERLVALLASAATCFVIAIVFLETAHFELSRPRRIVIWRRRWALRERSGSIPFSEIQSVQVERPIGDTGTPSRRITLKTKDGSLVPLTVGYRPDADDAIVKIADRIRALLGHDVEATARQDLEDLIAAGKTIEAIKVLRETQGLSLTDAKQRVDDLRRKASSR